MASSLNPIDSMEESDEEIQIPKGMNADIPECEGLPRRLWNTKCVTLYNADGVLVGEGTCHSINSDLVLGASGPLGDTHVAIFISKAHLEEEISHEQIYSLIAWPIKLVHCRGASLHDHEAWDNFNSLQASLLNPPSLTSARLYTSILRNPSRVTTIKSKGLFTQQSINAVSSKVCCIQNCIQPFPREKIRAFRECMYHNSTFKHRAFMKIDVYKQIHYNSCGKKMVTVEEILVCMQAWMHIAGVLETTFFCYQKDMKDRQEAMDHGNTGLLKPRKHTQQATATLKCLLDKEADHMPHCTQTIKSREKVVSMCLPAMFQWKGKMKEINDANVAFGFPEVSTLNLSKIKSSKFPKYEVKKLKDNFARCTTCDKLQELRKSALASSNIALMWAQKLDTHLAIACTHWELYYANRY